MSLFSRLRRAFGSSNDYWYSPVSIPSSSGVRISEQSALKYLTVFSCVSLIAGDIARLPLNLYKRRKDGGKDIITDHDLYDLLHNAPNSETNSFGFRETLQGHLLLWGNAFSFIERANNGKIKALWQFSDPGMIEVDRVGSELVYKYKDSKGRDKRVTRERMFHIPGYGFNGLVGISMISLAREAIGLGIATESFGGSYFGQGTHPSGVLEMDGSLGDNRELFTKAIQKGYAGLGNSHKIMLLESGMKYKPLTVPLNDAQFLETRTFQKSELAAMYAVPLHKIGVHGQNSNYNNLEQENSSYVDSCLMHWIVRWESAISQQLLTPEERKSGLFFEFLVQGLLRGDSAARAEYYNKIFQVGGITPNEIRSKENMNPVEGGDQNFVMLNMVPLDKAEEMQEQDPVDEPAPVPEKKDLRDYFALENEKRSAMVRDRIANRYEPLLLDAAQSIVAKETLAIKKNINNRADFEKFLRDFYRTFPEYINKKIAPVLRSYMQSIIDAANTEFKLEEKDFSIEVRQYIDRYIERHILKSEYDMLELADDPEAIEKRADEWNEKRTLNIAKNEKVRALGAAYSFAVLGAGLSLVWRIRGLETCPWCRSLSGKRIKSGETFLNDGDLLKPDGDGEPMKINGIKMHPPAHGGCDCYVTGN